ncbi:sigma-70 family RNA polymerase sigma factor [Nocardioides marmoraquaticus]
MTRHTTSPSTSTTVSPPGEDARRLRTAEVFEGLPRMDPAEREAALAEVIELNMPVADRVARRFARRGIAEDDLRQVAYLALTRAAQNYDVSRAGSSFLSYAVPTMQGEVRKHFRDHGWMVRPTRRVQEMQAKVNKTRALLVTELQREPSVTEVAERLGEEVDGVLEASAADGCFTPSSLDAPAGGADTDEGSSTLGSLLGSDDRDLLAAEARVEVEPLLRDLGERDQRIIGLRYYQGLTQREIAEQIGVTQMQVSRLLSRILGTMREKLEAPAA